MIFNFNKLSLKGINYVSIKKKITQFLPILLILILLLFALNTFFGRYGGTSRGIIGGDGRGYHIYLPAIFLHGELSSNNFVEDTYFSQNLTKPGFFHSQRNQEGERVFVNKYNIGVAVMQLPFFFVGHLLTLWYGLPTTGYSYYYAILIGLAGLIYGIIGLYFLQKVLIKNFGVAIAIWTTIAIYLGTNLFVYATTGTTRVHVFVFCLFSIYLYLISKWYECPNIKHSVLLGINMGLILLVRSTGVILLLAWPLYGIFSWSDFFNKFTLLRQNYLKIIITLLVAILIFLPQSYIWFIDTGKFLINSYGSEVATRWWSPKILSVLFSIQKGLFFWTPVLFFSAFGLFFMSRKHKHLGLSAVIIPFLILYTVASWHDWQFGYSFGQRAFIDIFPLLAILMGCFIENVPKKYRPLIYSLIIIFIFLRNYLQGRAPAIHCNWIQFKGIFENFTWKSFFSLF